MAHAPQDQSTNRTQADRAMAILQTLTGNINVPGGWVLSRQAVRGKTMQPFQKGASSGAGFYDESE